MRLASRVLQLRQRLADDGFGAFLISQPINVAYVTGFERVFDGEPAHAAVITADSLRVYTDSRYSEAMRGAAGGSEWEVVAPDDNMYATLCSDLSTAGVDSLAIEESVPHGRFRYLSRQFDGNVEAIDQWVEELRQAKEPEEVGRIESAQQLTDEAFLFLLGMIKPGLTEREIALELEMYMRRNGSEGVAFPPIVASGPNSALPHAIPGDRKLEDGDWVILDFGAKVDGYCSDMTRTIVLGYANERQRSTYEAVLAANEAGISAAVPGMPGKDVDAAARAVLEDRGFGAMFTHSLGHGVGMEVHELPVVGKRGTKSLRAGSVITIEPGVYEPGVGGVRIEDLVVVEDAGARVLTASAKDLVEL